jgi:conjugal transfer pilus assembly protein TraW
MLIACALSAALVGGAARAESLGRVGQVYGISEPDLIEFIKQRLRGMEASGEMQRLRERFSAGIRESVEHPARVTAVTATTKERTFFYNPAVTLDYNITDDKGAIIVPAGTTVNPLDTMRLTETLIFFDGNDPRQVRYVREEEKKSESRWKLVLVGGSPSELMKQWHTRVYFDQGGRLVAKFGITQVPATVSQDGDLLKIHEFIPD